MRNKSSTRKKQQKTKYMYVESLIFSMIHPGKKESDKNNMLHRHVRDLSTLLGFDNRGKRQLFLSCRMGCKSPIQNCTQDQEQKTIIEIVFMDIVSSVQMKRVRETEESIYYL